MKGSAWIVGLTIGAQLLLAASALVPATAGVWHADDPAKFNAVLVAFVGVQFGLLSLGISLLLLKEGEDRLAPITRLLDRVPGATVRQLRDDQFYREFFAAVQSARGIVRISYFAPTPPGAIGNKERDRYYADINAHMRDNETVRFKRIVRDTPANRQWLGLLVRELEGASNVDLAVLQCDLAAEKEMPLSLSVQVVDDSKVWLVAVASHEREGDYRDVFIESLDAATAMTAYYTRLWTSSKELLKSGVLTEYGQEYLAPCQDDQ